MQDINDIITGMDINTSWSVKKINVKRLKKQLTNHSKVVIIYMFRRKLKWLKLNG